MTTFLTFKNNFKIKEYTDINDRHTFREKKSIIKSNVPINYVKMFKKKKTWAEKIHTQATKKEVRIKRNIKINFKIST